MLGLLGNILTANDKYPLQDSENSLAPLQMQLSPQLKTFSAFLIHLWKLH